MKAFAILPKLLSPLVSLFFISASAAADETREIEFRVLCLEHLDDVKSGEISSGDSGKKLEISLPVGRFSEQFEGKFTGKLVTFSVKDRKAPKGRRVVASGELSDSKKQVFLTTSSLSICQQQKQAAMGRGQSDSPSCICHRAPEWRLSARARAIPRRKNRSTAAGWPAVLWRPLPRRRTADRPSPALAGLLGSSHRRRDRG